MEEMQGFFFGNVHGVGFRATALRIAQKMHLKGYVRNCSDGSVEIVAQGTQEKLQDFVQQLRNTFKEYVTAPSPKGEGF